MNYYIIWKLSYYALKDEEENRVVIPKTQLRQSKIWPADCKPVVQVTFIALNAQLNDIMHYDLFYLKGKWIDIQNAMKFISILNYLPYVLCIKMYSIAEYSFSIWGNIHLKLSTFWAKYSLGKVYLMNDAYLCVSMNHKCCY